MQDKRCYHRMKLEVPMNFRVPPKRKFIDTSTLDISGTGVAFITTEELKVRQELLIYLLLPGHTKIEIHAKVVRVAREEGQPSDYPVLYRIGVKIVDPIKFDERAFVKFYAEKLLEFFGRGKYASAASCG